MNLIYHHTTEEWGETVNIMEGEGKAFARAYTYFDDDTRIYLDMLTVSEEARKQGFGTHLQEIREKIGKEKGCRYSFLWVKKGSWMRKWYARRGYEYYSKKTDDKTCVWLRKRL